MALIPTSLPTRGRLCLLVCLEKVAGATLLLIGLGRLHFLRIAIFRHWLSRTGSAAAAPMRRARLPPVAADTGLSPVNFSLSPVGTGLRAVGGRLGRGARSDVSGDGKIKEGTTRLITGTGSAPCRPGSRNVRSGTPGPVARSRTASARIRRPVSTGTGACTAPCRPPQGAIVSSSSTPGIPTIIARVRPLVLYAPLNMERTDSGVTEIFF